MADGRSWVWTADIPIATAIGDQWYSKPRRSATRDSRSRSYCRFYLSVAPESSTSCPFSRERSTGSSTCSATSFRILPGVSAGSQSSRSPPSKEARQFLHGPAVRAGRRDEVRNLIFRVRFKNEGRARNVSVHPIFGETPTQLSQTSATNSSVYMDFNDSQLTNILSSFAPNPPWQTHTSLLVLAAVSRSWVAQKCKFTKGAPACMDILPGHINEYYCLRPP